MGKARQLADLVANLKADSDKPTDQDQALPTTTEAEAGHVVQPQEDTETDSI